MYPSYQYFDRFLTDDLAPGLDQDSDPAGHPLSKAEKMAALDDIDNQFDDVSYSKVGGDGSLSCVCVCVCGMGTRGAGRGQGLWRALDTSAFKAAAMGGPR